MASGRSLPKNRKSGPGTSNLVYGIDVAKARIAELEGPDWNKYLFPSDRSASGHRDDSTLRNWSHDFADRVGIPGKIDGNRRATNGRRFWYTTYTSTMTDVLSQVSDIASEQGSASAQVVWDDYLSEEEKRSLRR